MKIAFIGQKDIGPGAPAGGVETYVAELAPRLVARGHRVRVFSRGQGSTRIFRGVKISPLGGHNDWHWAAVSNAFVATLEASSGDFDIINYQGIGPGFFSWLARIIAPSAKIVVTFHSRDYEHSKWPWFGKLFFRLGEFSSLYFSHKVVVVGQHLNNYIKARYGRGVDYIAQGAGGSTRASFAAFKKARLIKDRYILSVGRLEPHKGFELLIRAYQSLAPALRQQYQLVIVGTGRATYLRHLKNLGRGSGITFLGELSRGEVKGLLENARLFVLPSSSEGLSITLLEALAARCAVLVSDIPANREVVQNPKQRFKIKEAGSLNAALKFALNEAPQGHAPALTNEYSWDQVAARYDELYREVLGG